jgi:hypothetical protein
MLSSGMDGAAGPGTHPVTITIDGEHPGPVVPDDFAGLSFERGPLNLATPCVGQPVQPGK